MSRGSTNHARTGTARPRTHKKKREEILVLASRKKHTAALLMEQADRQLALSLSLVSWIHCTGHDESSPTPRPSWEDARTRRAPRRAAASKCKVHGAHGLWGADAAPVLLMVKRGCAETHRSRRGACMERPTAAATARCRRGEGEWGWTRRRQRCPRTGTAHRSTRALLQQRPLRVFTCVVRRPCCCLGHSQQTNHR